MPNINIEDAYILDETGAQVDKVTGLFTKDENTTNPEKAFAQLNIGTAGSNRNLLDNPWFRIDQLSVSGTITSGYIADRWTITYGNGGVQASRTEDTITVKSTNGSSHGDIAQKMEKSLFDFLVGKIVTASVMRSDGSVISKSFTFQSAVNSIDVGTDLDGNVISVRVYQASTYQDFQFWKWKTAGTFRAVKLELGSVSTLANDAPPDYGEELAKCGRYFFRAKGEPIAVGYVSSNLQYVYASVPALAPMRATPTISYSGGFTARLQGASIAITSMYASAPLTTGNAIGVRMVLASSASAVGPVAIYGGANDYIDLSANL